MSTCVITGGAGFLGSHLCEFLLGKGHRVICVDNLETGSLQNIEHIRDDAFEFRLIDITERVEIPEQVDFVYHLASPASPIDYLRLPLHTLKVGSHGTHHMLGLAKFKRARFLLASTSEVYGDPQVHPQAEDYWGHVNPIGPRGVYDEAKRYAEALTMAYHRQQGVDTSIVRIFNSVLADEQILFDDGRELQRCTAEELAARLGSHARIAEYSKSGATAPGGAVVLDRDPSAAVEFPVDGFSVPSFSDDGRMVAAEPSGFIGHPTEQRCYEVTTQYGRSVKVTGDHSLFVKGEDGEPTPRPVNDLEVGDRIAIAGRVAVPERDHTTVSMIEVWRWAENDPLDLYAEGSGLGELVWQRRFDVFGLLAKLKPGEGKVWRNGIWKQIIEMRRTDRVTLPVLWRLGEGVPEGAVVRARKAGRQAAMPARVEITDDLLWLLGLYVAEGCMHEKGKNAFISISCERELLEKAARIVQASFGLHVTWSREANSERSQSIFIHSKLLLRLWDFLGLDRNRKRIPGWILGLPLSRLKWFIEGYREGDGIHSGRLFDEQSKHQFSTVHEELKDDLVVALARFGLVPSVGRYRSHFRIKTGEREYPFWQLSMTGVSPWSPLDWDRGVEQALQARRHGDLVWAPVRKIEEVPATELVFDFSVPGLENFLAGTGVIAKNTYGPRMRAHDGRAIPTFLRQALKDQPLTVFGDGSQTRSFCFVDDLIRGIVALAESDVHTPVNVGNPNEFTLLELAKTVIEVTESRSEIVYEPLPVDDPQQRRPDITRARDLLGWQPKIELREGLQKTIEQSGLERLVGASD